MRDVNTEDRHRGSSSKESPSRRPVPFIGLFFSLVTICFGARGANAESLPEEVPSTETSTAQAPRSEPEVRSALERVLSQEEFSRLLRMRKQKENQSDSDEGLFTWLERLLAKLFGDRSPAKPNNFLSFVPTILVVMAALILVFVIFLLVNSLRFRGLKANAPQLGVVSPENPLATLRPGEISARVYLERAVEQAENHSYSSAIRCLLFGSMSWIERRGLIRHRRGLTNRDYRRAIFSKAPQRESFITIADEFEEVVFGRREATSFRFERCLDSFRRGFGADDETKDDDLEKD